MDSRNLLIFTVYVIIVFYVLYQAYKSLDNQVVIELDSKDVNKQLEEKGLTGVINVKFRFKGSYRLEDVTKLPITITNTSSNDETVRVDWDESSITDFDNITGRAIRIIPGMTEIPQIQAVSVIVPGRAIKEELSDDKMGASPLFKPLKLKKAILTSQSFFLRLFFTVSNPKIVNPSESKRSYTLYCRLLPKKLRLSRAIVLALKPKPSKKK